MSPVPRRRKASPTDRPPGPRVRPQEQLLLEAVGELPVGRLLCNTAGWGQFARFYAAAYPRGEATCWFLDVYQRDCAAAVGAGASPAVPLDDLEAGDEPAAADTDADTSSAPGTVLPNVTYACAADPPGTDYDVVAWCCSARGDGELTRETLQLGHERLRMGGRFLAAIDNPRDQWLHEELHKLFPKVTRRPLEQGVLYLATKTERLHKLKSYQAEFAFRDQGKLIYACSRPGVFSHRHIDGGARALILTMEVQPRYKVLDLGCGTGVVSLAALSRAEQVQVLAVDANPRALECVERGARRNELTGLETRLDATGESITASAFDLVCANPPYYSQFRIADLFLRIAQKALKTSGKVHVVTKSPDWFAQQMPLYFAEVTAEAVKSYWVMTGKRPRRT
jgi:16S rRNA G1207 methylase RsmC